MKKFLALLLAVVMVLTMVACGEGKKKADGQVVIGTSTEASGDWAYSAFVRNPNATDKAVMTLTDDMTTVDSDQHGDYGINKTVVKSYERIEEENGNVTYKFVINDGLKFNNGEAVTAQNFVAWTMFVTSPAGKEMGVVSATYNMLPGGLAYRNGETNVLSAVRLYDEKTFSITIAKTGEDGETSYLPYYYDITYAAMQAVNLTYWFGEGWSVKDDGEGVYFVNADGKEFTAETVGETVEAARFATGNRVTAGPYNLVSFDQSSREIVLEVNENYNGNFEGQKPGIQKLVIVKTSEDTVMDMITTGQIQIYSQIADGSEVNAVMDLIEAGTINSSTSQYDRAGYGYFGFACDLGPTQFTEFRQAIAYLLDRVEFAQTFCKGWGSVVHGPYCTAFTMTAKTDIEKKINHYDYNPEKAVELLKQAGFVYNADGSDYVDGSGEVRYAKVTEEQAKYYESFNKVLADGTILMPATVNWASSEGNAVSALLSTMLANSEATKAAGVSIGDCFSIAKQLSRGFLNGEYNGIQIAYTNFVSMLSQTPDTMQLLPLTCDEAMRKNGAESGILYEPSGEEVFASIVPEYLGGILYGTLCESRASEQAARRSAMDSATQNAEDMIADLSLKFNRARQASITQEITEIVAGS